MRNVIDDIDVTNESNATITVDENSPGIIYFYAGDADPSDSLTYILEGPDSGLFDLNTSGSGEGFFL